MDQPSEHRYDSFQSGFTDLIGLGVDCVERVQDIVEHHHLFEHEHEKTRTNDQDLEQKTSDRTSEMKADTASPDSIDAYIAGFPKDVQGILEKIRGIVRDAAPEAEEAIKYQIPTFVLNGNLVHFAAFQKHIGFYPTPSGVEQFKDDLAAYNSSKGSVQFPLDSPIPYTLIRKIVKFRVNENREKSRARALRKKKSRQSPKD